LASDFTGNCQDLLGTKKSNILPNISVEIFFKLAHFFSHFSQCNPISNIHPKHTDHCFQFFSNQTWSITNITRMPLLLPGGMRSVPGSERGPEPAFSKESAEDFQKRKFLQRFC